MDFLNKVKDDLSSGPDLLQRGKDIVDSARHTSKGVQVYFYSSVEGCRVEFSVPGNSITKDQFRSWSNDHLEVESSKIEGSTNFTGRFSFRVTDSGGRELANQWVDVSAATGNVGEGTMVRPDQTKTITAEGGIMVNFGFYDAGSGMFDLPSSHQCYVTITHERKNWMGELAPRDSPASDFHLSRFALPAPHDCGMNSMDHMNQVLHAGGAGQYLKMLKFMNIPDTPDLTGDNELSYVGKVVFALSITQKDSIDDMLRLGARYFEFRPGKLPPDLIKESGLEDKYYYLHAVIPGLAYEVFLENILDFLNANQDEICVVQLRGDGVLAPPCIRFEDGEVDRIVREACERKGNGITTGNEDDMRNLSIHQLRDEKKRLIIVKNVMQYSTYDDLAYASLDGVKIVERFDNMQREEQGKHLLTLMQCQATASNIREVVGYSVAASDASTSCLMATKTLCDTKTHPWLWEKTLEKLDPNQSLVIMNDWLDGATCDIAIELSKKRFEQH